ncbi:hypothetical protein BD626DRAFT_49995 [Schizophyllum amplum]|uniref:Uncharacterized protein n=1 Tax=Schizophyllum amplum TaxID=97359 RepID=A0A550CCI4_9AGAR|nr:hypothetical protein BD626DRAFT_49995 [Auriculariopsis ampla]
MMCSFTAIRRNSWNAALVELAFCLRLYSHPILRPRSFALDFIENLRMASDYYLRDLRPRVYFTNLKWGLGSTRSLRLAQSRHRHLHRYGRQAGICCGAVPFVLISVSTRLALYSPSTLPLRVFVCNDRFSCLHCCEDHGITTGFLRYRIRIKHRACDLCT